MRLNLFVILCGSLSWGTGCATTGFDWMSVDEIRRAPVVKYPEADGLLVLHDETLTINGSYAPQIAGERREVHTVVYIRRQEGLRFADFRLPLFSEERLAELSGRTIGADGRVTALDPERVMKQIEDSREGTRSAVVAMPQVEPGSFVELRYAVVTARWHRYFRSFIRHSIPALRTRFRMRGTGDVESSYVVMNMDRSRVKNYAERAGFVMKWELDDVEASESEPFSGDPEFYDPWWSFSVARFRNGSRIWFQHQGWGAVFLERSKELFSEDFHEGFTGGLDIHDCNLDCRISRARDWVEARVALREGGASDQRSARGILAAKEGNRYERGRLLHRLLTDARVKVQFAFTGRRNEDFQHANAWNAADYPDLLLRIDDPEGRRTLWLDPAAPGCPPGTLSEAYLQNYAIVIEANATRRFVGDHPPATRTRIDAGLCTGIALTEDSYEVAVDGRTGDAAISWRRQGHGPAALLAWSKDKTRSANEREKWANETLISRHPRARSKRVFAAEKTAAMQVGQRLDFEIKNWGFREGDTLTVPLNILQSKWEGVVLDDDRPRKFAFRLGSREVHRERLSIQIPVGYTLVASPEPTARSTRLFEVESRVVEEGVNVSLTRTFILRAGVAPASDFDEVRSVFEALRAASQGVLVFKKIPAAVN